MSISNKDELGTLVTDESILATDAGEQDTRATDAGEQDTRATDAGEQDTRARDAGEQDTRVTDAGEQDTRVTATDVGEREVSILDIVKYPNPILLRKADPVNVMDNSIRQLVDNMLAIMYRSNGIGLAANQVAVSKSIFVMDLSDTKTEPYVFINPEILLTEGELVDEEGCLSFPGVYVDIERPTYIKIKALDYDGKEVVHEFSGLAARCVHHEHDHLIGKIFLDHLGPVRRRIVEKTLARRRKGGCRDT